VLVGLVWIACGALVHVDQVGSRAVPPPPIRARVPSFDSLQKWFELVRAHEIGEWDQSAKTAATLDTLTLMGIRDDLRMVRNLLETVIATSKSCSASPTRTCKPTTGVELYGRTLNLKSLAPLMGLTEDELDLPAELSFLGDPENPSRRIISRIMIRAAMLHTREAMEPVPDQAPEKAYTTVGSSRAFVQVGTATRVQDGQQTQIADLSMHWEIAREALDIVGPPAAASPAVRAWYDATMEYLQNKRLYNALLPHLERARKLFPNDARVWLFNGAAWENLAAPKVQAAALERYSGVGKPGELLRQAEHDFRRALELDPNLPLTKLRLGHVLVLTNRHDDAAPILQAAETALAVPEARYLAALFLGRAEEARGRDEAAQAAYRRAADLFAGAQSPRLALASLAWRRGEQDESLSHLRVLATVNPLDVFGDPWWRYDVCHVGDIDVLFDRLDAAVARAMR
jgi:tetratricopeptide (TPR) repeat protein